MYTIIVPVYQFGFVLEAEQCAVKKYRSSHTKHSVIPGSIKKFTGIVEYAYLDKDLWAYLQDKTVVVSLREALIQSYFPKYKGQIDQVVMEEKEIINLNNRKILLPQDKKYAPKAESLTWRHTRILK